MIFQRLFPNGSLVHSTLFIQNGNFRAVRKIVAASLAQSGPPPCFLEKSTYMLVNPNVDLTSLDKECHLTSTEREHIDKIKGDLSYQWRYWSRLYWPNQGGYDRWHHWLFCCLHCQQKITLLREIKESFKAYGLEDLFLNHSELCRPLFIKGHVNAFGARIH